MLTESRKDLLVLPPPSQRLVSGPFLLTLRRAGRSSRYQGMSIRRAMFTTNMLQNLTKHSSGFPLMQCNCNIQGLKGKPVIRSTLQCTPLFGKCGRMYGQYCLSEIVSLTSDSHCTRCFWCGGGVRPQPRDEDGG